MQKTPKKFSQRDMAGILRVDVKTLRNWKKYRPELYNIIMLGFQFRTLLEAQKQYTQALEELEKEISENIKM